MTHRPDLQGLRAIAVLLVVLSHTGMACLSGGYVGVDVFFVLSGSLITGRLLDEHASGGRIDLPRFYARRLRRLLPGLATMLIGVTLLARGLLSPAEFGGQAASLPWASSWSSNVFFALSTTDYFGDLRGRDLFLHTWSLGVEEQFYLVWPLILLAALTVARGRSTGACARVPWIAIATVGIASLLLHAYWALGQPLLAFYLAPARFWEFAAGAGVAAWQHARGTARARRTRPGEHDALPLQMAGIVLILASALAFGPQTSAHTLACAIPAIGAMCVVAARRDGSAQGLPSLLSRPALVWIGDRSYAWYLWHWPAIALGASLGLAGETWQACAWAAGSLVPAATAYRLVELPIWRGGLARYPARPTILAGTLASVFLFAAAWALLPDGAASVTDPRASLAARARADMPPLYRADCDDWFASAALKPCVYGNPQGAHTAVLIGDSIGTQWYGVLPEIFRTPAWRLVVLTKSACPMVDEPIFYTKIGRNYTVCAQWRDAAIAYVTALRPDVAFVGSSAEYAFSRQQWTAGSVRLLERLAAGAKRTVVIAGTPGLSFDGPGCLERRAARVSLVELAAGDLCAQVGGTAHAAQVGTWLGEAARRVPRTALLDLADVVCPGGRCSALDAAGVPVFRDRQHLTDRFVRGRAEQVRQRLALIGVEGTERPTTHTANRR